MELSPVEIRVLGCLVEKEATTPQTYPLSTNALVAACNQLSSRDPVVQYDDTLVTLTMRTLRERELARTIRHDGSRVYKHLHALDRALGLNAPELAVLSVLMLRGPQTAGELRTRCERQHLFDGVEGVEQALAALAGREPALAVRLERLPGQKEARWQQLLGETDPETGTAAAIGRPSQRAPEQPGARDEELVAELEGLRAEVAELRERVATLEALIAD